MTDPAPATSEEAEGKENSLGIPKAVFVTDPETFVKEKGNDPDQVLKDLNVNFSKYRLMEQQLVSRKRTLLNKIPDFNTAIQALEMLEKKKESDEDLTTTFELADSVHLKAKIKPSNRVFLWLGANVMLEYSCEEAKALLQTNMKVTQGNIKNITSELEFLKDQITVCEVNIARVHNFRVKYRRQHNQAKQ